MFSRENHGAGLVSLASQFRLGYCCACSLALLLAAAYWPAASPCFAAWCLCCLLALLCCVLCLLLLPLPCCTLLLLLTCVATAGCAATAAPAVSLCAAVPRCPGTMGAREPLFSDLEASPAGSGAGQIRPAVNSEIYSFPLISIQINSKFKHSNSIEICLNLESGQIFLWNLSLNVTYRIKI
jgi:hypothetical protein